MPKCITEGLLSSWTIETKDLDRNDVWHNKNSDDFLRYLKWECFTIGYNMAYLIMVNIVFAYFQYYYCEYTNPEANYNFEFHFV